MSLVEAVRREIDGARRVPPAKAALALELAATIDAGELKGTELAALSRELRILLDQVAAGGSVVADPLDELQRRRREKATGA